MSPKLMPREALIKTSAVDYAEWNYHPVLRWIQRLRFSLAVRLLNGRRFGKVLEIGYGSGVFMPELAQHCDAIFGVDPHPFSEKVTAQLATVGIKANLKAGSVVDIPFGDELFDAVICVSALEYVDDIERACREIYRVLKPGGCFIVITPGHSPLVDFGLRILTGESASENYGKRRERLIPALRRSFTLELQKTVPRFNAGLVRLYSGLRLLKQAESGARRSGELGDETNR